MMGYIAKLRCLGLPMLVFFLSLCAFQFSAAQVSASLSGMLRTRLARRSPLHP